MQKSLKDISWNVSEEVYRQDPALSYSTLARYEREGFNSIPTLFDKIESPSLTFGSAVDAIITGGMEEFNQRFLVTDNSAVPSDTLATITKMLFDTFRATYDSIEDIPDDLLLEEIKNVQWNNHWQNKTRVKKIKEDCSQYYKTLYLTGAKTIINSSTYKEVMDTVDKLKSSNATKYYFEPNTIFASPIERLYQLKFKATFDGVPYRCMCDELIILHDSKRIIPIDLKTSSSPEWDFYKSFIHWNYAIQARLYYKIIAENLKNDPVYKEYVLTDYKFIVINKRSLTPLVWTFSDTKTEGTLVYGKNNNIELRDPLVIGSELHRYLKHNLSVPLDISENGLNELTDKLKLM